MWTASKLSRNCAHHHQLAELRPNKSRDAAAQKGRVFDAALVDWYREGRIMPSVYPEVDAWVQTMADHGWSWPDRCELQVAWGLDKWGKYCAVEEKPEDSHNYIAIDGISDLMTAGRADACWIDDDVLVNCDWKSGRTLVPLASVNLQLNAGGIALAQRFKARAYRPVIYYAREARWDVGDEVEAGSLLWASHEANVITAAQLDALPHPGAWCESCWERKNCPSGTPTTTREP